MTLHFNTNKEMNKEMVEAIEKETRCKAEYIAEKQLTVIGEYTLTDDGTLSFADDLGGDPRAFEHSASVIDACVMVCGCPVEFGEFEEKYA